MSDTQHQVNVRVDTRYLPEQSAPEQNRFAFAYTVTIENQGEVPPNCCRATGSSPTATAVPRKFAAPAWSASNR